MSRAFVDQFIKRGKALPSGELPSWWATFRNDALQRLEELEMPGRKEEEWRFIKLNALSKQRFGEDSGGSTGDRDAIDLETMAAHRLAECEESTLVFLNGRYQPSLSSVEGLASGVVVKNWKGLLEAHDPDLVRDYIGAEEHWKDDLFYQMNGANFEDGAVILVPRNTKVEAPIHLLFLGHGGEEPFVAHPRNLFVIGESSEVTMVEEYIGSGTGSYFHNVVDEVSVGANASVKHFKIQRESTDAFHIARNLISLAQDSRYISTAVNMGAALSRNDSYACYKGQNIECTLDGLAYIRGKQVSDTHTAIDHALPNSRSFQLHKTIVDEQAHSVFNGKIFVRQDAQQTRSEQLNQNLILSQRAQVDTKPQLEILADDVVCSHGATVGQLQDDQFFYLKSRGIDHEKARALLTFAFAAEVLETISVDSLRKALEAQVLQSTDGPSR